MKKFLGIDIGGTDIKYALMDENAEVLEKAKVRTPLAEGDSFETLVLVLEQIIHPYEGQFAGIAISLPGIVDSETGHSYTGGALVYLSGKNLAKTLAEKFSIPVTVENDGKCAAVAELWKGSLQGVQNGSVVLLGTGVGGGIIINGALYKGKNFAAGEYSFKLNSMQGDDFWAVSGGVGALLKSVSQKASLPETSLNGYKVFELANAGDERVLEALDEYTKGVAFQLYNLQTILDLELIAIGGGISRQPLLLAYIQKHIDDYAANHPLKELMPYLPKPVVTTCRFFNDSNLIGALYQHLNHK